MREAILTNTKTKQFLQPEQLLRDIPVIEGMVVADFGCGSGHYAAAAGILVGRKGQVFALDILEEALSQTAMMARLLGLHNITTKVCDLEKFNGSGLSATSCDLVMIVSLLHQVEHKDNILREGYRILKTGGQVLVADWILNTFLGPPLADRINKDEAKSLLEKFGLRPLKELPAGNFHYALLYSK